MPGNRNPRRFFWYFCKKKLQAPTFSIFTAADTLPDDWDKIADHRIFLQKRYLQLLGESAPDNMQVFFVGLYNEDKLQGIALIQVLDFRTIQTFGNRDHRLKNKIRTWAFKQFSSRVVIVGNNMLTGQHAFAMPLHPAFFSSLHGAVEEIGRRTGAPLTIWKDFYPEYIAQFPANAFQTYYQFSTQPNMVLDIQGWKSEADYVATFLKKYRDQYKRARKKALDVERRILMPDEINRFEARMHHLYLTVAQKAPFNTFFLPSDHFYTIKKFLNDDFSVIGYFYDGELIGFCTIIRNNGDADTYFLGYDEEHQKTKMLYLNMLYDMIGQTISSSAKRLILARTALEIKSSVGAVPLHMFGYIKHRNSFINSVIGTLFRFFEPKMKWQQRHPFK